MNIYVTSPAGMADTVLKARLRKKWSELPNASGRVFFVEPEPFETHGELLTRIWQKILDTEEPMNVITETDFIPYQRFYSNMHDILIQGALATVPYCTREPDGILVEHAGRAGAWLLGINRAAFTGDPPLNWLEAGGDFNDAANMAVRMARVSGAVHEDDVLWLDYQDEWPQSVGLEYQLLGYHCFYQRHFDDPPEKVLADKYTLGDHLQDIVARLDALEP